MRIPCIVLVFCIAALPAAAADLLSLLPRDNDVQGWRRMAQPKIYTDSQLWERINGGADVYLTFGFKRVAALELESGKRTISLDVYEMGTCEGAFGIYARERAPSYHFIEIGAEGYQEGVSLNFLQDRYYVKLIAFTDDAISRKALDDMARFVSRKIGADLELPPQLSLFPASGLIRHSESYEPASFLDSPELRAAYTARYQLPGTRITAFLVKAQAPASAATRLHNVASRLMRPDAAAGPFADLGDIVVTGKHKEAGDVVLVVKGRYIAGAYPAKNTAPVRKFLTEFLKKLK